MIDRRALSSRETAGVQLLYRSDGRERGLDGVSGVDRVYRVRDCKQSGRGERENVNLELTSFSLPRPSLFRGVRMQLPSLRPSSSVYKVSLQVNRNSQKYSHRVCELGNGAKRVFR